MKKKDKDKEFLNQSVGLTGKGVAYLKVIDYCKREYPAIWNDYYYQIREEDTLSHKTMMKKHGRTTTIEEMTNHILNFTHQKSRERENNFIKYKIIALVRKIYAHLLDIREIWQSGFSMYKSKSCKETSNYLKIYIYVFKRKIISYWFKKYGIQLKIHLENILIPYEKMYSQYLTPKYNVWEGLLKILLKVDVKNKEK